MIPGRILPAVLLPVLLYMSYDRWSQVVLRNILSGGGLIAMSDHGRMLYLGTRQQQAWDRRQQHAVLCIYIFICTIVYYGTSRF